MDGGRSGSAQLLCALAILVALAAVLVASPGDRATAGGDGEDAKGAASLGPDALARISVRSTPAVARRVARIRGLEFKRVPKPEVVDSDYLNRLGKREFERAGGRMRIGADEAAARITGLLAPDEQLESLYGSTGDLAAAAYDTERDRLYVVSDAVVPNRALVEFVLAHELDHALEDERYGLPDIERLDDDAALAQTALTEGSATSVMVDYGASYLSPTELLGATAGVDDGTAGVPKFAVDQLLWTYLQGNDFVAELRGLAGGWKLVDYAIEHREPASTEQILHPTKYVHDELAAPDPGRRHGAAAGRMAARRSQRARRVRDRPDARRRRRQGGRPPGGGGLGRRLVRALAALRTPGRVRGTLPLGPRARDGLALGLTAGREAVRTRGTDLRPAGPRWRGPRA